MPNTLGPNGLTIKSATEILDDLTAGMQSIYGADINVAQNSPDGQMLSIFQQAISDILELLDSVYASFDVPDASGIYLDQRVALNGLTRRQGTYTIQPINISVSQALTLKGLDGAVTPVGDEFTVYDNAGNDFILETTDAIGAPGTYTLNFRAKDIGQVETTPNTITNQRTIVLGVTGVNNPAVATSVGVNEETDAQLKVRHARSFFLGSTGPADAVEAALGALPDVTGVLVKENPTGSTDGDGTLAHTIWCIVEGGSDAEVANAIYAKKAPGCGMRGAVSYVITRPNLTTFTAKFDRPVAQDLFIQFSLLPLSGSGAFDVPMIKTKLTAALVYLIGQGANVGQVIAAMQKITPTAYLTGIGVSTDGMTYLDNVVTTSPKYKFVVDPARITIS